MRTTEQSGNQTYCGWGQPDLLSCPLFIQDSPGAVLFLPSSPLPLAAWRYMQMSKHPSVLPGRVPTGHLTRTQLKVKHQLKFTKSI